VYINSSNFDGTGWVVGMVNFDPDFDADFYAVAHCTRGTVAASALAARNGVSRTQGRRAVEPRLKAGR
jgi:hypothetical protein